MAVSVHRYILSRVEFVSDVSCDDRALADILVSHQHDLEFLNRVPIARKADTIAHLFIYNQIINPTLNLKLMPLYQLL